MANRRTMVEISVKQRPWANIRPTGTACTIWRAMCGSGVWMSTARFSTLFLPLRIRSPVPTPLIGLSVISQVLKQAAHCAAVRGTAIPSTYGLPIASRGGSPPTRATMSGFVA